MRPKAKCALCDRPSLWHISGFKTLDVCGYHKRAFEEPCYTAKSLRKERKPTVGYAPVEAPDHAPSWWRV